MVVKIGSSTVVGADGKVNRAFIGGLADQAAALRELGWHLVVVSSGAIACGYPVLGFDRKPVGDLPSLQACASAGQCIISSAYDEEFHARDLLTSLVLLTRHDTPAARPTSTRATPCCAWWSLAWCRSSTRTIPLPSMRSSSVTTTRWRRL